jgi:hypothetical protein
MRSGVGPSLHLIIAARRLHTETRLATPLMRPGQQGAPALNWLLVDPGANQDLLLVRRSISKPSELAYYVCRSRTPVPLAELVRVAGSRWGVEECLCATRRSAVFPV